MTVAAKLSNPDAYAIAMFHNEQGKKCIVLGNIGRREKDAAFRLLFDEAYSFFGKVEESGVGVGSVPDRYDAYVIVESTEQSALHFIRTRLEGSANQMKPKLA